MKTDVLSPAQLEGAVWLGAREGSYLADPPGFGKTRQVLYACQDARHVTVVCPAVIRDSKVWEREAALVGFDVPMKVMSYHQLAKTPVVPGGALVFDEAHRLKSKDVSWAKNSVKGAASSTRTHLASGTPTPNGYLPELYAQMRLINPAIPNAYWNSVKGDGFIERWFYRGANMYTDFWVPGTLLGCIRAGCNAHVSDFCRCPCCEAGGDCEHRDLFWNTCVGDLMLRRPESMLDLPDMSGFDHALDTPMTAVQKKAYNQLKRELIAELPEGITLEALTESQKFVNLMQASTGLSSIDDNPELDKHSGKAALLEEMLPDRSHPAVLGVYFRNSAAALGRLCERLNLRYAMFGAATPRKDKVVEAFQRGDIDVLVASIMVAREGITLTAADQVILGERSWVPGDNEQMVRRVRRRGQDKAVTVKQLVAPGGVEAAQWEMLQAKTGRIGVVMRKSEIVRML